MKSRLIMTFKNVFWSYFSMFVSLVIQFISRTVFIHYLGENYLGINGLFSNVLGVLSFAELGIGTAINFSLYKPVAEGNTEKIKSYMYYYKWAYRIIAAIVATLGLILVPFLRYLVKDPGNIGNIASYYLIYLFNTVSSYFVSYKFSLVNAEQKNYIFTNISMIVSSVTIIAQIVVLMIWKNYFWYLVIAAVLGLGQKVFANFYLNKLYPYLKERKVEKLNQGDKDTLLRKIKALIMHKIGEISVHQTDNIIVSSFVSVGTVGLLSNYNMIINTVSGCVNILFNSVTGSLGNLIATESKERQYDVFRVYRFIGFWLYGFSSIAFFVLLSPFITLWIGETMVINDFVIGLIILNYYMMGHRICLNNMKTSGGVFEQDKYVALIQALVNLVVSIVLVITIGLPGVYIGTIIQGTISTVLKPILVYKDLFGKSSKYYFIDSIKYGAAVAIALCICWGLRMQILSSITIVRFIAMIGIVVAVPNVIFFLFFSKNYEFIYVIGILKNFLDKVHR